MKLFWVYFSGCFHSSGVFIQAKTMKEAKWIFAHENNINNIGRIQATSAANALPY